MAAVWFLSDTISLETPELLSDKILHFLAYGLFGVLNLRALHGGFRRPVLWATVAALALTAGFGAVDEWRQSGVSFRDASWGDWVADLAGAFVAWLLLRFFPIRGDRTQGTEEG
ncbi:MAG: VanZ family protein [Acidobacteriota bacterium]